MNDQKVDDMGTKTKNVSIQISLYFIVDDSRGRTSLNYALKCLHIPIRTFCTLLDMQI